MTKSDIIEALIETGTEEYEHYGLKVYSIGGCEYAIGTEEEADEAAKEYIEQSVWAFNADFLSAHIEALDTEDIERLRGDSCEGCNDALIKLIDDFDAFVEDAISADGRAHFLNTYDGCEDEEGDFLLYRVS